MPAYNGFVDRLSRKIEARLTDIEAVYNFDLGEEFEVAVCHLLSEILPSRFGICRGFVVTQGGEVAGDDLIVFDRSLYPTLRSAHSNNFAIKDQVPVEAVYAYIECKHTIDRAETLVKAIDQVTNVKRLLFQRPLKPNMHYEENGPVYLRKNRDWPRPLPKNTNQPFAIVFARNSHLELLVTEEVSANDPDLIVLGPDKIVSQSVVLGPDGIKGALFVDDRHWAKLRMEDVPKRAFGLFIFHLLAAISWIELIPIDWADLLNDAY